MFSLQVRGSGLHTPEGPSPLNITEDTPASRLMAQGPTDTNGVFLCVLICIDINSNTPQFTLSL